MHLCGYHYYVVFMWYTRIRQSIMTVFISWNDEKNPKIYDYFLEEKAASLTLLLCSEDPLLMFMFLIAGLIIYNYAGFDLNKHTTYELIRLLSEVN